VRVGVVTGMGTWSPSTRHRALQHVPRLAERVGVVDVLAADDEVARRPGAHGRVRYFGTHALRYVDRWRRLRRVLPAYDALLVQRSLYQFGPGAIAGEIGRFDGRVVFDLDDAVFTPHPELARKGPAARWLYGPQQACALCRRADAIVVSTRQIADSLPLGSREPEVLPTIPDVAGYERARHDAVGGTVGWAGTPGGLMFLDPLAPVLERLQRRRLASVEVVSSAPWDGPARFTRWRLADERELFARFAVGIMPLPETPYTRAKAGFKLLQYMAAGVPFVASPVGVNIELVEASGAGRLARDPDQWEAELTALLEDPELRRVMGERGRAFVERYADLEEQADVLAGLLTGRR
jgi:glycosyltransferase involved in cell wall biosynthesis